MKANHWKVILATSAAVALLAGCAGSGGGSPGGPVTLQLWHHGAGNPEELEVISQIVGDFNASQRKYKVVSKAFPQAEYNTAITGAAAGGKLPCVLDVDGPLVPNWAWAKYLAPLELPKSTTDKFLPGTLGTYKNKLYAIGLFDAAVAIYARESVLKKHDIRIPDIDKPWTGAEFDAALVRLKSEGGFDYAIELGTGESGEWYPYGYSPLLQSHGGDLIDRGSMTTAEGKLNGAEAQRFGTWWHSLFQRGLANPREAVDRVSFLDGKAALALDGVWHSKDAIKKYGDDLLFLPPPDFGAGPKIGAASWQWAISESCEDKEGARAYLEFSLDKKYIAAFSDTIGLIPATTEAAALVDDYKEGGRNRVFIDYSRRFGLTRPPTPAYPVIASVFEKALHDIVDGSPVKERLDGAVDEIDANIKSNGDYGF